ncbi:MAG: metal-dependent transcriptional regulator [Phycisphaerae bacterium]|nr:metal-dependent transcriptional regulator [Phycisphaerae bacterium]
MSAPLQDYAKTIYALTRDGRPAETRLLAGRLRCSEAAVSKMLKSLARDGYVAHTPYRGCTLTAKGESVALETIRHHRLLERYLTDHLGFDPADAHEQAEILEHHISEEFEDRIAGVMGEPATCPHGRPIPPKPRPATPPLRKPGRARRSP